MRPVHGFRLCLSLCASLGLLFASACKREPARDKGGSKTDQPPPAPVVEQKRPPWLEQPVLEPGQVFALLPDGAVIKSEDEARAAGLVTIDLSATWAPYIFSESGGEPAGPDDAQAEPANKPNPYRDIFVRLANDQVSPDVIYLRGEGPTKAELPLPQGLNKREREAFEQQREERKQRTLARLARAPVHNYLEVYGIPPTLPVLLARIEDDVARTTCYAQVEQAALAAFSGSVNYVDIGRARREFKQADDDARWVLGELLERQAELEAASRWGGGTGTEDELAYLSEQDGLAERVERYRQGRKRIAAVKAAQARLLCEGLISPTTRIESGTFDLVTHEALAEWEKKNDVFSWGILGGETLAALQRPPLELHFETFRRILTERVVDAAGVIEDESLTSGEPPTYKDEDGNTRKLRNLVAEHRDAVLAGLGIRDADDMVAFLRALGPDGLAALKVAITPPERPPYYDGMELSVEIDRGDIWYDFPFNDDGSVADQPRSRYPSLTVFANWKNQRIPLARWRTTIGSWRSELHPDGNIYYKYKNSDVGPRIWKYIVAAPVWVPPDSTPGKDMLTLKKFEAHARPETVINTEVIGPGFASAYGLVMAIHHEVKPGGGLFDNQIRTHGSVDYTSIARRYSHGCHRLVNIRAVRLFGYVLRHTPFERNGDQRLGIKKRFAADGNEYVYELGSRGYYYRLMRPVKVEVLEGRIRGKRQKPIDAYVRKPGMAYEVATAAPAAVPVSPEGITPVSALPADPTASAEPVVAPTPPPDTADPAVAPALAPADPVKLPPPLPPVIDPAAARGEKPVSLPAPE